MDKYPTKPKGDNHARPAYAAMVETVVQSVETILGKLDKLGVAGSSPASLTSRSTADDALSVNHVRNRTTARHLNSRWIHPNPP